ncbi:ESCRT-II subunit protein snf8 [Kappamyces sp. JEL0829]|nr:ESCRT-II subunit protein snf8 [Kappamyces sp. JEL0829]
MKLALATFKDNLEAFAHAHSEEIKKNAAFRSHFNYLCSQVGVDPLASNKGFWTELLGFGDFYYELSVQIVQVCIATRDRTGGLIEFGELKRLVEVLRGKRAQAISDDDIVQSLKCLKPLGDGYRIVTLGTKRMVRSVPEELNLDHTSILTISENTLVKEGICWVDMQVHPHEYYIAGFYA